MTTGNVAVFEYPPTVDEPDFTLDNGVLWVGGYKSTLIPFLPPIGCIKRFDLNLLGYVVIGKYNDEKGKVDMDFTDALNNAGANPNYCVIMIKK